MSFPNRRTIENFLVSSVSILFLPLGKDAVFYGGLGIIVVIKVIHFLNSVFSQETEQGMFYSEYIMSMYVLVSKLVL